MAEMQKQGKPDDRRDDEWQHDLNPNDMAGQNTGLETTLPEKEAPTAYDIKELHQHLQNYSDTELKRIKVLAQGTRLKQGATYLDLNNPEREPFTAMGGLEVGPENHYVPKTEIDYELWNRLIGINDPERVNS